MDADFHRLQSIFYSDKQASLATCDNETNKNAFKLKH